MASIVAFEKTILVPASVLALILKVISMSTKEANKVVNKA